MRFFVRSYNYFLKRIKKSSLYIIIVNEIMWYYKFSARKFRKKFFIKNDLKSSIILKQLEDPLLIPIIIINFNQLYFLKIQVSNYLNRGFKNVIILDNASTYQPLLEYYQTIKHSVEIVYLNKNWGHMVFFENKEIYNKYSKGFFVISDSDIIPNDNLPDNFLSMMIDVLLDKYDSITKVGWALDIKSIPDTYSNKEKVINWEKRFWKTKIDISIREEAYLAEIDTTFALYKPNYNLQDYSPWDFFKAIRIGGNYTAKHGGWYINSSNLSEEQKFYFENANSSSSWRLDSKGELNNDFFKKFY